MPAQIVNSIALLFDIAGVLIVFKYGWPQPDLVGDSFIVLEGEPFETDKEDAAHRKILHLELSTLGLLSLVFGFFLQLVATWL